MPPDSPRPWWRRLASRFAKRSGRDTSAAAAAQADDRALVFSLAPSRIPTARQLQYLPRLLTGPERAWVRFFTTLAILSVLTIFGHAIMRHVVRVPADGGTLTEGMIGTPQFLNPVLAQQYTVDSELNRLLFRGLMRVDEQLRVVPDLIESLDVSSDGKIYTAKLRSNLLWSDDQPLNAADVLFTFETTADSAFQSPLQGLFKNVQVAMPDTQTVTFTLKEPLESFRSYLTLGLIPAHLWRDQTPQNFSLAEWNVKPITNGPYKFLNVTKDRSGNIKAYTLIRDRNWRGARPAIEKIVLKFYPEVTSAVDAFKSNAIDTLGGLDASDVPHIKKSGIVVDTFTLAQLTGVFFNQKNSAILKIKEVRQALALDVDRPSLVAKASGIGRPAFSPIVPGQPGFKAEAKHFNYNPEQANSLLEQAGWKRGANGVRQKGSQSLAFTLTTADEPRYVALANALAAAWNTVGFKVEVKTVPPERALRDTIRPRQYDALLYGQIMDTDGNPYLLWHSSQQIATGNALAVGYDKTIDQALDAEHRAIDSQKHDAALLDFQNAVGDNVPGIIVAQSEYLCVHRAALRGFSGHQLITPADRFGSITSWYLKTTWRWK